jgi:hypothetical protein
MCVGKERRVNVCHHRVFIISGMRYECFRYATFLFEMEDQGCFVECGFDIRDPELLVEGSGGGEVCRSLGRDEVLKVWKKLRWLELEEGLYLLIDAFMFQDSIAFRWGEVLDGVAVCPLLVSE